MKTYSKSEIASNDQWHRVQGHKKESVAYCGETFDYYILPADKCPPALPTAVQRVTGESPEDGTVFAVSENVRENVRQYPVLHEIIEFTEIGIDQQGRCAQASCKELELLNRDTTLTPKDVQDYIVMRRDFFRDLIKFVTGNDDYTEDDITEFRASLAVFEGAI
ncbi:MAG: hypothetical protein K9M03_01210 [Kiritimatiellales bacterium]|nr:hypothetical protein [Kiritimatiellales bacterium]